MKALVKYAKGEGMMELRNVDEPFAQPGQVKIKVKSAGICGSDIHIYYDRSKVNMKLPVIVGHEFSGEIVEIGPGVEGFFVGDRVVSESTFEVCGKCIQCRSGNYNICKERHNVGFYKNGAFAEYCIASAQFIHKIANEISYNEATILEPLACCVNGVDYITGIKANEVVVIMGAGTMGFLCLQLAKANGAYAIFCGTSRDKKRLELGCQLGADAIIIVDQEEALDKINKITEEKGADVILECSGAASAIELAINTVKRGGKITQFGLSGKKIEIPYEMIAYKQINVRGVFGSTYIHWEKAIRYLQTRKILAEKMISEVMPLEEWETAFNKIVSGEALKIILSAEI